MARVVGRKGVWQQQEKQLLLPLLSHSQICSRLSLSEREVPVWADSKCSSKPAWDANAPICKEIPLVRLGEVGTGRGKLGRRRKKSC